MQPTPLTDLPIPTLIDNQLEMFTLESIHAIRVTEFDAAAAAAKLEACEGQRVIGADFGGDKGATKLFMVRNGSLVIDDAYEDYVQGDHGAGYLESLEKTAAFATAHNIPVGISWGTPLVGTKPLYHAKAKILLAELAAKYDGDFAHVVPTLKTCINDGPAGLLSGALIAYRQFAAHNVLLPINGGGIGMAALVDGIVYSCESGHVQAVSELNAYNQTKPCGVFGAEYVCLETLGANKAGIEVQWQERTGEYMRARDIEDRYKEGDAFAGELYDHSALVLAHVIAGTAHAFELDLLNKATAIVGNGGGFKFPHYGDRIRQILDSSLEGKVQLLLSKDFSAQDSNACLDGAAIAALV